MGHYTQFTAEEDNIIRTLYSSTPPECLISQLPARSIAAIRQRAYRLGVHRVFLHKPATPPVPVHVTDWEIAVIKEFGLAWSLQELRALIPRRSYLQLQYMVNLFHPPITTEE